jgi:hypothetical protein
MQSIERRERKGRKEESGEGKGKTRTLFDDAESDAGSIGLRAMREERKMSLVRDGPGREETGSRGRS